MLIGLIKSKCRLHISQFHWFTVDVGKKAVLRIHLILMRIRILDPHWKKMDPDPDPDPGYLFKIYLIFLTKQNFQIFCLIFLAYFYAET